MYKESRKTVNHKTVNTIGRMKNVQNPTHLNFRVNSLATINAQRTQNQTNTTKIGFES